MKRGTSRHWKTERLMRSLAISRATAIGALELLWEYAADFATDGNLTKCIREAAAYAGWSDNPDVFIDALVSCGWLDRDGEFVVIHDWIEHCPDYVRKRIDRRRTTADNGCQSPPMQPSPAQPNPAQPDLGSSSATMPRKSFAGAGCDVAAAAEGAVLQEIGELLTKYKLKEAHATVIRKAHGPDALLAVLRYYGSKFDRGELKRPAAAWRSMTGNPMEWGFGVDGNGHWVPPKEGDTEEDRIARIKSYVAAEKERVSGK